jgi:hypothetical protein
MINLNYNYIGSNTERARFTEQENEAFRPFQIQYVIVPAGGGAAAGNNSFNSGSDIPKVGIAGNGGVIASGSFCVQPFITYPIVIGKGGKGGFATSQSLDWTGSNGGNSAFYNIEAIGGDGGKSQVYITSSTFAGNGAATSASIADGGSGSQWTYNLPGCLPDPFNPGCHGGQLISESYYSGGGAGIAVSASVTQLPIEYIIVGGGGAGQSSAGFNANGGGGGAVVSGSFICEPIVKTYPIIVGAGGIAPASNSPGLNGSDSLAFSIGAQGGFGGGNTGNSGTGSQFANFIGGFTGSNGGAGAREDGTATVNVSPGVFAPGSGGDGALTFTGLYYGAGRRAQYKVGDTIYNGSDGLGINNFGSGGDVSFNTRAGNGVSGSVIIRYLSNDALATGGEITITGSYIYHTFTSSADFVLNDNTSSLFTSGLPGVGSGNALFSVSGSLTPIPNTGGGAAASYYNQNGVSGSDGFVAIRYEGAPLAEGGNIIVTDFYTYHLFSSSGDFYVIGQESNPNINPCI